MPETVSMIPIGLLIESPTNPRKTFDEAELQELADNIRQQGILQPIVVRPVSHSSGWEIVFGHRRVRAADLAELDHVPAIVRAMTDVEVAFAQLAENAARADVHPIEEADALHRLMRDHGLSIDDLMLQTGKSRTAIYNRLKLASLTPEVREQCRQMGIGAEIATLIARVPGPLQAQAVERCTFKNYGADQVVEVVSYRNARAAIQRGFTRSLLDAPFHPGDHFINCDGPCHDCRKCSNNEEALFDLGANVCTDIECFDARKAACWAERIETARRAGLLLEGHDATNSTDLSETVRWSGELHRYTTYADLVEQSHEAGHDGPQIYKRVNDDGEPIDCLKAEDAKALLDRARPSAASGSTQSTAAHGADDGNEAEKPDERSPEERALASDWPAIRAVIGRRVMASRRTAADLRLVLRDVLEMIEELPNDMESAFGWPAKLETLVAAGTDARAGRLQLLEALTPDEMAAALVLCAIDSLVGGQFYRANAATVGKRREVAALYGVDPLNPTAEPAGEPLRDPRVPDMFDTTEPAVTAEAA